MGTGRHQLQGMVAMEEEVVEELGVGGHLAVLGRGLVTKQS